MREEVKQVQRCSCEGQALYGREDEKVYRGMKIEVSVIY